VLIQNREITHPDVTLLVRSAEDELHGRYPEQTPSPLSPSAQFVVAYVLGQPVGCGALAPFEPGVGEVKRMYVQPGHRRTGVGRRVLRALERRAVASGLDRLILETGIRNPEAIALYESAGFERTEPYGEYIGNQFSVCLLKKL
jgi:putative acetyltransferase